MIKAKQLILTIALAATTFAQTVAQNAEGSLYYLPKTELRFKLIVEKNTFTPGEFAIYTERFLKKTAPTEASETYSIVGIEMSTTSIPDTSKEYMIPIDKKHTVFNVEQQDGILVAINARIPKKETPATKSYYNKTASVNPHDFMSEDILKAGSTAKMAELTAREIYDIRASRNELSRGEADYMPKDGEQLKLMFANLDRQEEILSQTFTGVNVTDTMEYELCYTPEKEGRELFFRFSKKLGLVDNDDLGGAPYYINIDDMKLLAEIQTDIDGMKPSKDPGIAVKMPGKIKVSITEGKKAVKNFETYAAQFGQVQVLSSNLFGKRFTTHLILNPITGNVESMEVEPLE